MEHSNGKGSYHSKRIKVKDLKVMRSESLLRKDRISVPYAKQPNTNHRKQMEMETTPSSTDLQELISSITYKLV